MSKLEARSSSRFRNFGRHAAAPLAVLSLGVAAGCAPGQDGAPLESASTLGNAPTMTVETPTTTAWVPPTNSPRIADSLPDPAIPTPTTIEAQVLAETITAPSTSLQESESDLLSIPIDMAYQYTWYGEPTPIKITDQENGSKQILHELLTAISYQQKADSIPADDTSTQLTRPTEEEIKSLEEKILNDGGKVTMRLPVNNPDRVAKEHFATPLTASDPIKVDLSKGLRIARIAPETRVMKGNFYFVDTATQQFRIFIDLDGALTFGISESMLPDSIAYATGAMMEMIARTYPANRQLDFDVAGPSIYDNFLENPIVRGELFKSEENPLFSTA